MKKFALVGSLVAVALITGCASAGNETLRNQSEATVAAALKEGKSTKADVRAAFGSPMKTNFTDGGKEIWNYEFNNVSADAISYIPIVNLFGASASGTKKELVVLFGKNDVVERFSMSESDVKQKTGLFNQ